MALDLYDHGAKQVLVYASVALRAFERSLAAGSTTPRLCQLSHELDSVFELQQAKVLNMSKSHTLSLLCATLFAIGG